MRLLPLLAMSLLSPGAALAERVPVPAAAQEMLKSGDYLGAATLIQPVLDRCFAVPEPGDSCIDIMVFMLQIANISGNAKVYDDLLAPTLRYAELTLPPLDRQLADLQAMKADRLYAASDFVTAEPLYRQVIAARRAATPVDDVALEIALTDLELVLTAQRKFDDAMPVAAERLVIAERSGDSVRLAQALWRAGDTAHSRGRYAEAEGWLRRSVALEKNAGTQRWNTRIAALRALALALFDQRKITEARAVFVEALALATAAEGANSNAAARLITQIATMDRELGDIDGAEAGARRALAIVDAGPDKSIKARVRHLSLLSTLLARKGQQIEALRVMQQPVEWWITASEQDQAELSDVMQIYASILVGVGRGAEAEPIARRILAVRKATTRHDDPMIGRALDTLGYILFQLNRPAEALEYHIQAVQLLLGKGKDNATVGRDDLLLNALGNLATTLVTMGKIAEAEPFQTQAYDLSRKLYPAGSGDLATALDRWAYYRRKMGRCDGLDAAREARAIWANAAGAVAPDRVYGDINLALYLRLCGGSAAEQRTYWIDAMRYLLADAAQSTDYDTRATGVLRDRSIAFRGVVDANWQLTNPPK